MTYRIKRVTNQTGQETFFPQMEVKGAPADPEQNLPAGWRNVPWFEPACPSQIEAQAAIQRHKDRQTKDEVFIEA